jgi:hypothetical protein
MEPIVLEDITFQLDLGPIARRMRISEPADLSDLRRLGDEALAIGRPRALFGMAYIESKGDNSVVVDGVTLTSQVLRVNVDKVHRVFPFLATGGMELEEWTNTQADVFQQYWADAIAEAALRCAMRAVAEAIDDRFQPGKTSAMNPGSLEDWPMPEQAQLFSILGDTQSLIGVRLTDSFLMVPRKSVSGFRFPTESTFANCQLCPRDGCPGRSAAYDSTLWQSKYGRS